MRPTALAAVLMFLLVTAGCLSTGGAAPVTVTPAPVPADDSTTTDSVEVDIPTYDGYPVATLGPDGPNGEVDIPTYGGEPAEV